MFIGAVGVGGNALAPLLLLCDVPLYLAGATLTASMLPAATAAVASNWRRLPKRRAAVLCAGSVPGACLAELLWPVVPALVVSIFISVVSIACGVHVVVQLGRERWRQPLPVSESEVWVDGADGKMTKPTISPSSTMDVLPSVLPSAEDAAVDDAEAPANADLNGMPTSWTRDAIIGVLGGFFSVMSATGGSFMTIPMLLLADPSVSPAHAVCLGQAIAVPITACTALVAAVSPMATLDVALAGAIGSAITLGVPVGVRLAQHTKPAHLRLAIALCLLAGGATALEKTIYGAVEVFG